MEGKANFSLKNVDNQDKETFDMNYQLNDCRSMENLKAMKKKIDEVVSAEGGIVTVKLENKPEAATE